jgi:glycosyltransferase involved in cell wall biosynthesis
MKVSIFTPTHQSSRILEAYNSIKDQDFYEWIIGYNNGAEIIDLSHDPRVKSINLGNPDKYVGLLKGLLCELATGDILLELDHDDLLTPDAIEEVKNAFEDPEVGFAYSNTIHSTGDFKKIQRFDEAFGWKYREVKFTDPSSGCVYDLDEHLHFDAIPTVISRIWFAPNHLRAFRRTEYEKVGGYNRGMRILDDLDLMCKLYATTKFKHIDKGLYVYRVHGDNTFLDPDINPEIQNNVYRIHDMYFQQLVDSWADRKDLMKVELGGRMNARQGYTTVDLKDAHINRDLNKRWPFEDSSVGVIRAFDVLEHLKDPIHTMEELYRVLVPGGYAIIQVPSTDGRGAFQDPTHVSFWNENSFKYYTDRFFNQYIDCDVRFQAVRLYTTDKNQDQVCWVIAHLIKLDNNLRLPGLIHI